MNELKQHIVGQFGFNNFLLSGAVAKYTPEQWINKPNGKNHAVWMLAHLSLYRRDIVRNLGDTIPFDDWETKAAYGSACEAYTEYPAYNLIHTEFEHLNLLIAEYLINADDKILNGSWKQQTPGPEMTVFENIKLLANHELLHIGQLSDRRKDYGLPALSDSLDFSKMPVS